jgi:ribonucleoside-triphosphate reductase
MSDSIMNMTSKYGLPYFANFANSDLKPEDVRSMCCRLRIDNRELMKRTGGIFASAPLTGSIGVVTLNMSRIGYETKDEDKFIEMLDRLMDSARDSLIAKRTFIEKMTETGLYPYCKFYLRSIKEMENSYWAHHFNTIGLIGMNEGLVNMFGKGIADPDAKKFALKVLDHMKDRLMEYQNATNQIWNLEATPGEGNSYRFAKIDRQKYKDIYTAGKDYPFYTNSTWLPVDYDGDVFDVLSHQEELQTKYTGGTVIHMWLGESPEPEVVSSLVKKAIYKFRNPYYTISPTYSICPVHGYISGRHDQCPHSHSQDELVKAGLMRSEGLAKFEI